MERTKCNSVSRIRTRAELTWFTCVHISLIFFLPLSLFFLFFEHPLQNESAFICDSWNRTSSLDIDEVVFLWRRKLCSSSYYSSSTLSPAFSFSIKVWCWRECIVLITYTHMHRISMSDAHISFMEIKWSMHVFCHDFVVSFFIFTFH